MVSDQDIARGVLEILSLHGGGGGGGVGGGGGDVSTVVQQLSVKLGLDLTHKSAFIADQINLLRRHHNNHFPQQQLQFPPPPQTPPSIFQNDHFALQNNPQFLQQFYYQQQQPQQQQQQQQQVLPSPFTLHFGEYSHHHVPQPQGHVDQKHHVPHYQNHQHPQQQQQHVTPPPVKNGGLTGKSTTKESTPSGTKRRGGSGGLNKLCGVSPELQAIVGEATMARTEIVRQLWVYIRKNNLQDPSNRRKIICDEALRVVLETDSTDMFKMNKLLAKHILPLGPRKDSAEDSVPSKRQKLDDETASPSADTVVDVEVAKSADTVVDAEVAISADALVDAQAAISADAVVDAEVDISADTVVDAEVAISADTVVDAEVAKSAEISDSASVVVISDALGRFLGTTRREMLASEAIQHVCEYVKLNSLEDIDSLTVICDEKLRELLGCERISMLEINETLARHHLLKSS